MLYRYGVGGFLFQIHDSIFSLLFENKVNHFVEFCRFKITVVPSIIHFSLKKTIISQNDGVQKSFLKIFWEKNHFSK